MRRAAYMIVDQVLRLSLAWTAGVLLAFTFFGGFWWTVRKSISAKESSLWLCCTLALRISPVLIAIYTVSDRQWERLLLCLLGFVMARPVAAWFARVPGAQRNSQRAGTIVGWGEPPALQT
jgi:F1F0 ATPase subunit 2